jgi:hypothetical protein
MKKTLAPVTVLAIVASLFLAWTELAVAAEGGKEKAKKPELPAAAQGFSGIVAGKVTAKTEGRITLAVEKVAKVWEQSKAKDPEALIGQKIIVTPAKAKEGEYAKRVARFLNTLKVDQPLTIEVKHVRGMNFSVLELTEEQRKAADETQ